MNKNLFNDLRTFLEYLEKQPNYIDRKTKDGYKIPNSVVLEPKRLASMY